MVDTHTSKILGFIGATYLRSITLKTFHTFHKHPTPNHLSHQETQSRIFESSSLLSI